MCQHGFHLHFCFCNFTLCIMRGICSRVATEKQVCFGPWKSYICAVGEKLPSFPLAQILVSYQGEVVAQNQIISIPSAPIGKAHVSCQLWFSIQPRRSCTAFQIIVMLYSFQYPCETWRLNPFRCFKKLVEAQYILN